MTRTLIVALGMLVLGAPGAEPECDVVWLKNGRKLEGLVLSETETEVVFQSLIKGRKGQTVATAGVTLPRDEIDHIDRMSDEARRAAMARSTAFGDRRQRLADALDRIAVTPARVLDRDGLHTVGTHFEVFSTCEETFVREVTHYLDEVFTAYKQSFAIRRNADRKIRVFLLSDQDEYRRYQVQAFGVSFENPAFYHKGENLIAAYNMVRKDEADRIRQSILEQEEEIKKARSSIRELEARLHREAKDVHQKILTEAARARRQIQNDAYGEKAERLRKVDAWQREQLALLAKKEKEIAKKLDDHRKSATEAIEHNRDVIARNRQIYVDRNRAMYEMLFHEGFHAFAVNFLWGPEDSTRVPRWLDEGLACYYEMSAVEVGELIHGASHPVLLGLLRNAIRDRKLLPLEKVIGGDATKFLVAHRSEGDRSNLYYAQSWAIAHSMAGRVPRERMEAYVDDVLAGMDSVKAFEKMMGKPIRVVEREVRAHVESLE